MKLKGYQLIMAIFISISMSAFSIDIPSKINLSYGEDDDSTSVIVKQTVDAHSGSKIFNLYSDVQKKVNIRFWQCGSEKNDSFNPYSVVVNEQNMFGNLVPNKSGWCYLELPEMVLLNKGNNKIEISLALPALPDVEFVEIVDNSNKKSTLTMYDEYLGNIKSNNKGKLNSIIIIPDTPKDTVVISNPDLNPDNIPYSYNYADVSWFGYTFYTTVYCSSGEKLECTSIGNDNIKHFIEVFSSDQPSAYSWSCLSGDDGVCKFSEKISHEGLYYVRVRPFYNGKCGFCSLSINNIKNYKDVPLCSMGVVSHFVTDYDVYNVFTCNSIGDPMITLNKGKAQDSKVYSFNDDYVGDGDFNWKYDARISKKISKVQNVNSVIVTSASSYNPIGRCNLYMGCKYSSVLDESQWPFMHLQYDDALNSAPATNEYNCFAWSGGIVSSNCVPGSVSSTYTDDSIDSNLGIFKINLPSLDKFYSSERYPGCAKYKRSETIEDGVDGVDIWGFDNGNGDYIFTHASIAGNVDGHLHGYSWESKLGSKERIFHPRDAIRGSLSDTYGKILFHYEQVDPSVPTSILEEAVADNKCVMANINLSDYQEKYLEDAISNIDRGVSDEFDLLYSLWQYHYDNTCMSNPDLIKDCNEYNNLISLCLRNEPLKYKVFDKVNKGHASATVLFEDLIILKDIYHIEKIINIIVSNKLVEYDKLGRKIIYTIIDNQKALLSQLLPSDNKRMSNELSSVAIINNIKNDFSICINSSSINVNCDLKENSVVQLDLLDLNGNIVKSIFKGVVDYSKEYQFNTELFEKGVYLVRLIRNGNIEVKKIFVNDLI